MLSLELFNVVESKETKSEIHIDFENGYVIPKNAAWAKEQIINFYKEKKLSGEELNSTFHKSWKKIIDSSRLELAIEQFTHYLSTYGSNFEGEIYIPNEVLNVPDLNIKFIHVKTLSKGDINNKCLSVLESGVALKEDTLNKIFELLNENNYTFTGNEVIKNKEALTILAKKYGIYPTDPVEFLRYVILEATGSTLLIKNHETTTAIRCSGYNPTDVFNAYGLQKLSTIFNRFKVLFLAFKQNNASKVINKIAKLSKFNHQPMVQNPLNQLSHVLLDESSKKWLNNATVFTLLRGLNFCYINSTERNSFLYKIRNGRTWAKTTTLSTDICSQNFEFILSFLKENFSVKDKTVFIPDNINYSLPTSEKNFVGHIPMGTQFLSKKAMAVGVYWENSWGAHDIDVSALNIKGKVGWNSAYKQGSNLIYSGDVTDAYKGAVEYMYAKGEIESSLIVSNIYSGKEDSGYQLIIGEGDSIDYDYMMNPNNVMLSEKCESIQKQTILGLMTSTGNESTFTIMNVNSGNNYIGNATEKSMTALAALAHEYSNQISLKDILSLIGYSFETTQENADIDLSLNNISKEKFILLFEKTLV